MIEKIIVALFTGFFIVLMTVLFFGMCISAAYTFVFQIAFWTGATHKIVITALILLALLISCLIFAAIADKD